jgi:hypothetical protein
MEKISKDMTENDGIEILTSSYENKRLSEILIGIFRCKVAMGTTPFDAYEYTLRQHIKHFE